MRAPGKYTWAEILASFVLIHYEAMICLFHNLEQNVELGEAVATDSIADQFKLSDSHSKQTTTNILTQQALAFISIQFKLCIYSRNNRIEWRAQINPDREQGRDKHETLERTRKQHIY